MPITCKNCSEEPQIPLWCNQCKAICCKVCQNQHKSHSQKVIFLCQECQESPEDMKTQFCGNCEQHLCLQCSQKIHNKGKRAKHIRFGTSSITLDIKRIHIVWDDVLSYYGFINYQSMLMEISDLISPDRPEVVLIQKNKQIGQLKDKSDLILRQFNSDQLFDEEYFNSLKLLYPNLSSISLIQSSKSEKYFDAAKKCKQCKIQLRRLAEPISKKPFLKCSQISGSSLSIPNSSFKNKSNISAKYPQRQTRHHHLGVNISTSTENSLRKRKYKAPIIYFHPYLIGKEDPRSQIQDHYRQLVCNGVLMLKNNSEIKYDHNIMRTFMRNIGEKQVEYVSLAIDTVSVQCLYWIIRSIQQDKMAPTEKLILSRLKQSFDIKVHSKLWSYILRYLSSGQYDRDRSQIDRICQIPKLKVQPFSNEDNYIIYCRQDDRTPVEWTFQDLSKLDQNSLEWQQFLQLIDQYFAKNTQIGGGRYGCVQFIKFNAQNPLRDCSLGKMSMFVQEAINKGIIRYHKTLLVSNKDKSQSEHSQNKMKNHQRMIQLQKSIKINTLQLVLFDLFEECGPNIPLSLAQIPQNLRKNIQFQINYNQLGFPKLKNLLGTLNDFLEIQLNKSAIVYSLKTDSYQLIQQKRQTLCRQTDELLKSIMQSLLQIIKTSNMKGMVIQQLYKQFCSRTGFYLDSRLFNTPDFVNFISYYGQNYFDIQNNMGYLIVYQKVSIIDKFGEKTSTPTFKQTYNIQSLKNLNTFNWQTNFLAESTAKQQQEQYNQSQSFSDYRSIYNILDDQNSQSKPNTVIVKDGSGKNQLKFGPIQQNSDCSGGFDETMWGYDDESLKNKNKQQHNRMYSNTTSQKPQHFRVYSNMSRQ